MKRAAAPLLAMVIAGCTGGPGVLPRGGILPPRVSETQEIRVGQRASREIARMVGLVADQELQDYVQQLGERLAASSGRSNLTWTFRVLDDPMPNGFALPGGYVYVTRGLIGAANSEGELAGAIAHVIGHVVARHGGPLTGRGAGPQLGVWATPVASLRALDGGARDGVGLLFIEHTADAERRANELAAQYLTAAGYEPGEAAELYAALTRLEASGGRSALPAWLATHPELGARGELAGGLAESVAPPNPRSSETEFIDHVEDLAYGQDPRQGFFRGSGFVHPELRFRIDLPEGWTYRSLSQAIVATSPNRDAALQLTVIEQIPPADAASRFLAQAGVRQSGELASDTVGGEPRVTTRFRSTSGGGIGSGIATWMAFGGRTYQLTGLATGDASNGLDEAFLDVARSFAAATDRRQLDVRPNRINIVRLGRATTFADFNRRYPSVIDVEELALLNRVAGANARLRAGARVKRVVKG